MRRYLLLIAILASVQLLCVAQVSYGDNILVNTGFDEPLDLMCDSVDYTKGVWVVYTPQEGATMTIIPEVEDEGEKGNVVRLECVGEASPSTGHLLQGIDICAGEYRLSMDVKPLSGDSTVIYTYISRSATELDNMNIITFDSLLAESGEWSRVSRNITVDNVTATDSIYLAIRLGTTSQAAVVDNITLCPTVEGTMEEANSISSAGSADSDDITTYIPEYIPETLRGKLPRPEPGKEPILIIFDVAPIKLITATFFEPGNGIAMEGRVVRDRGYIGYGLEHKVITAASLFSSSGPIVVTDMGESIWDKSIHGATIFYGDTWVCVYYADRPEGEYKSYMGEFSVLIGHDLSQLPANHIPEARFTSVTPTDTRSFKLKIEDTYVAIPPFSYNNGEFTSYPEDYQKVECENTDQLIYLLKMMSDSATTR